MAASFTRTIDGLLRVSATAAAETEKWRELRRPVSHRRPGMLQVAPAVPRTDPTNNERDVPTSAAAAATSTCSTRTHGFAVLLRTGTAGYSYIQNESGHRSRKKSRLDFF